MPLYRKDESSCWIQEHCFIIGDQMTIVEARKRTRTYIETISLEDILQK